MPELFTGYSERQWLNIKAEAERSRRRPVEVDMVFLLDTLERYGRNYASLRMDQEQLESFVAEAERLAKIRRQIVEECRLPPELRPPELQQGVAEAVGKLERYCQVHAFQLSQAYTLRIVGIEEIARKARIKKVIPENIGAYKTPLSQNFPFTPLDCLVGLLFGVWLEIGGDWWSRGLNTKDARAFIAACAEPVVGKRSGNAGAIGKRLQRLITSGAISHANAPRGGTPVLLTIGAGPPPTPPANQPPKTKES